MALYEPSDYAIDRTSGRPSEPPLVGLLSNPQFFEALFRIVPINAPAWLATFARLS
jgi:hypothetical protein